MTQLRYILQSKIFKQLQKAMKETLIQTLQSLIPDKKIKLDPHGKLLMTTFSYYILAALILVGCFALEHHAFIFVIFVYSIIPLLDELVSMDWVNPTTQQRLTLEKNDFWFKFVLYFTAVCDWFFFFRVMDILENYEFTPFSILNLIGILFIFSSLLSTQFAVSHQIFHKQNFIHRFLGTIHMSKLLYMHFTYEHIWGHHRRVATLEDPASAEKGTNIFSFIKRSFLGSYKSVYNMEVEANKPIYLNCAVLSVLAAIAFCLLIWRAYGTQAFVLYIICAFTSIAFLEAINYIEHYGLRREKKPDGEYEKVTIRHSWNAPHRMSNYLLYKLQRHSDHHQNSLKPYQTLYTLEESPQLSHGYTLTLIMSFFPKVWFTVMDPLVDEYTKHKTGNIDSEVRAKANKLIRYFIAQLSLTALTLCVVNYAIIHLGEIYAKNQSPL